MKKQYFIINTQKEGYPLEQIDRKEFIYWLNQYAKYAMDQFGNVRSTDSIKTSEICEIYNPQGFLIGQVIKKEVKP